MAEFSGDTFIKDVRAWSKLMKDALNQRGRRGETPVMVACEEGSAAPRPHPPLEVPPELTVICDMDMHD